MADFTGFYLGNVHSSTYGILRVSDGDRYTEGLIPEFENFEVELVGGDGSAYGGRQFKKTNFEIKIAFDHLTEKQFRAMRTWLGKEELQPFRFDERPYKTYWVKLDSRPNLEYLCFMENSEDGVIGEKERIYKGEGELEFIAFDPFGYCIDERIAVSKGEFVIDNSKINWQDLASYSPFIIRDDNSIEWAESSGLKTIESVSSYSIPEGVENSSKWNYYMNIYNPGDFETDFQISFLGKNSSGSSIKGKNVQIYIYSADKEEPETGDIAFSFKMEDITKKTIILLDTKRRSLSLKTEDGLSMRYDLIESFSWPKIPLGEWKLKISTSISKDILQPDKIKYNYKYY